MLLPADPLDGATPAGASSIAEASAEPRRIYRLDSELTATAGGS